MIYRAIALLGLTLSLSAVVGMIGLTMSIGVIPYPLGQILMMALFAGLLWLWVGGMLITAFETQPQTV